MTCADRQKATDYIEPLTISRPIYGKNQHGRRNLSVDPSHDRYTRFQSVAFDVRLTSQFPWLCSAINLVKVARLRSFAVSIAVLTYFSLSLDDFIDARKHDTGYG